ncbi:MAG: arylsulfatase [Rikenellaceae bacterium]
MNAKYKLPLILLSALALKNSQAADRNVIFILTDDYSCGEHGIYGNDVIKTPNLDTLANESVRFDNFYVGPTSSPTRAQLMTGKHEFSVGVTHTMYPRAYLSLEEKLLPEYFTEAGYSTAHFGKWHLGNDTFDDEYSARARGFQTSLVSSNVVHFDPELMLDGVKIPYKGYRTDILFDEAQKWIDEQIDEENSFFCYLSLNSAHGPYDCPEEYKEMYRGKLKSETAETYYGMITNIDDNVGELIAYMKEKGIYENTILVYMTDNGHVVNEYNAEMRGNKNSQYRGGSRVPCYFHCPDVFEGGKIVNELGSARDFLPTILDLCKIKFNTDVEGVSLKPLLLDKKFKYSDRFIASHSGRWADGEADNNKYHMCSVQNKKYRLVDNTYLFDIENDPSETTDIAEKHPELVAEMKAFFENWWETTRPLMINEERAVREGGSRMSVDDVEFRKKNNL